LTTDNEDKTVEAETFINPRKRPVADAASAAECSYLLVLYNQKQCWIGAEGFFVPAVFTINKQKKYSRQ